MEVEVMATMYCQICDRYIDLDWDVDHEEFCLEEQERMAINFLSPSDKAKAKLEGQRATMGVADEPEDSEAE
jgi:hypothetical protein